jgi:hypothetical protein
MVEAVEAHLKVEGQLVLGGVEKQKPLVLAAGPGIADDQKLKYGLSAVGLWASVPGRPAQQ